MTSQRDAGRYDQAGTLLKESIVSQLAHPTNALVKEKQGKNIPEWTFQRLILVSSCIKNSSYWA